MSSGNEIDVMREVDLAIASLSDVEARRRVLRWVWDKHAAGAILESSSKSGGRPRSKRAGPEANRRTSSKRSVSIVKDLNLRPSGQESFVAFAESKRPSSNPERGLVAIYYLSRRLSLPKVTTADVYTCFKEAGWRVPADLENALQWTASQKGWIDTSDMDDIRLTARGENRIEHDMPAPAPRG